MSKHCAFKNKEGQQCRGWALKDKEFCFIHEPSLEEERKVAQSKGGSRKRVYAPLPKVSLRTPEEIRAHLEEITNLVRSGEIEDKKSQLLQKLSDSLLKSLELGEMAEKMEVLESEVSRRSFDDNF